MSSRQETLDLARSFLGIREDPDGSNHNRITERFADLTGWEWARRGNPWCDMSVTVELLDSGVATPPYAYTPTHLAAFKSGEAGAYVGGKHAGGVMPGDVVFYSLGGKRTDHVGLVEAARADGSLVTLEGNVGNAYRRQERTRRYVTGFGRPAYDGAPTPPTNDQPPPAVDVPVGRLVWPTLARNRPDVEPHTRIVQQVTGATVDGDFGDGTHAAVKNYQRANGHLHPADGVVGPRTGLAIVQNVLRDLGYYDGALDGDPGPATSRAFAGFQATWMEHPDGIFGPDSTRHLWAVTPR